MWPTRHHHTDLLIEILTSQYLHVHSLNLRREGEEEQQNIAEHMVMKKRTAKAMMLNKMLLLS